MTTPKQTPDTPPSWLHNALRELPHEMTPARDLWPGIAGQLQRSSRPRWKSVAIAASVVVSVLSAASSFYFYQRQQMLQEEMAQLTLQKLESPYQFARVSYVQQWPQVKQSLDPETVRIVEHNLNVIATARVELAKALHKNPDDQVVQNLLRQTLLQEIDTYAQVQKRVQKISAPSDQTI